ncbi:MAG: cbb3-type cytochrome oxidase assembly protein CcoS [Gammaproteobacteria bacterium]|nr:cbb3-type cytochrome oxidase assembly protein CcoS [Gammaproteobacteria bacterium]MCY4210830.1 cbb3-type cytochrome oxidase assembly protein CcoS [Gammaproteobacteria bacterium]MCY4281300.1 cbb3-type cytochrome oxidase assembly protein CcoS [Gammaproteobacteria bacterium]MCY4338604.1 cbb3-type cytochrome oxidase assembly protein CcoS [Gammaproteobacteria bacterium]
MEIIYLLIGISLALVAAISCAFYWTVKSGQYDDLEAPSHRLLADDDSIQGTSKNALRGT